LGRRTENTSSVKIDAVKQDLVLYSGLKDGQREPLGELKVSQNDLSQLDALLTFYRSNTAAARPQPSHNGRDEFHLRVERVPTTMEKASHQEVRAFPPKHPRFSDVAATGSVNATRIWRHIF
jgi:hypothetical protein